MIKAPSKRWS